LVKLLKFQGKISKGFNSIIDKLANGITLNPRETVEFTKYLNDNQDALKKDSEYLFRKGEITDEEYKQALKNKEKEVKKT
jgi:mannitol/fructose-specific phosphotransferase system IIA component (Ntr-type)